MEILLGLLTSGITELVKLISKKIGKELTTKLVYGVVFLLTLAFTLMIKEGLVSWEHINQYLTILSVAVANYELVVKRILKPALG